MDRLGRLKPSAQESLADTMSKIKEKMEGIKGPALTGFSAGNGWPEKARGASMPFSPLELCNKTVAVSFEWEIQ